MYETYHLNRMTWIQRGGSVGSINPHQGNEYENNLLNIRKSAIHIVSASVDKKARLL